MDINMVNESNNQEQFRSLLSRCERVAEDEPLQGEPLNLTPEQSAAALARAKLFNEQATTDASPDNNQD